MSESESFSSLADLINSHLSKPDVQASASSNHLNEMIKSSINIGGMASSSDTTLESERTVIVPGLKAVLQPEGIASILAKQVSNTLLTREMEQKKRLQQAELEEPQQGDDVIIDLMKCIQLSRDPVIISRSESPDVEDIEFTLYDNDDFVVPESEKATKLPCLWSLAQQTKVIRKLNKKASEIGKAICTQYREEQEPYYEITNKTNIVQFDFNTPSPDDMILATLKKPVPRIFK